MLKWGIIGLFLFVWFLGKPIFNAMVASDFERASNVTRIDVQERTGNYQQVEDWSDPFSR